MNREAFPNLRRVTVFAARSISPLLEGGSFKQMLEDARVHHIDVEVLETI